VSAADRLREIMDKRIAIHDGTSVEEPMVPLRAPSFPTWGNPWFLHEPPPSASCTALPRWASRRAEPGSGRGALRTGYPTIGESA
jgi:hypothetical protein